QNPNLVYAHRTIADAGIESEIGKQKSVFNHCRIGQNTPDQPR
ncbi:hypothetical protein SAMN02927937_00668, partial [Paenimyroides aquimaris]